MQLREVSDHLSKKKNELINLLPSELQETFKYNSFIGGGCIWSLYNDNEVNDYDFFLKNEETKKELRRFFVELEGNKWVNSNIMKGEYKGNNLIITQYAITLGEFQIVTKWFGEVEDVVMEFDFMHNMCYFDDKKFGDINYTNPTRGHLYTCSSFDYLEDNVLRYNENRARDICGTILRIPKFAKKGFVVPKREMAKMLRKLEENGFDDREEEILENYGAY